MLGTFAARTFSANTFVALFGSRASTSESISYASIRLGDTTEITVSTTLESIAWYCWYVDGAFVGKSRFATRSFHVPAGEQLRLECIPTVNEDFDPIAAAPAGYPSHRTLWWVRSLAVDAVAYRVDQREETGDWIAIARIPQGIGQWDFSIVTGQLQDLTQYTWRVVAIDAAGNESEPIVIGPEFVVRTPDAPAFAVDFVPATRNVEVSAV